MISRKYDYSYLLDNLRKIAKNSCVDASGKVINFDGSEQEDEHIILYTKFYILYCMAYKNMDELKDKKASVTMSEEFVLRALTSYGMFNYFINTCIGEYRMYDDIGTGKVTYVPYQPLADFFFENDAKKEVLCEFIKKEILDKIIEEKSTGRVK